MVIKIGIIFYTRAVNSHLSFLFQWPRVYCIRLFNFEILSVVETDGIFKQFSFNFKETFLRSFVSSFKYCGLCNNSTSHQLVLKQVPRTALMITSTTANRLHT